MCVRVRERGGAKFSSKDLNFCPYIYKVIIMSKGFNQFFFLIKKSGCSFM